MEQRWKMLKLHLLIIFGEIIFKADSGSSISHPLRNFILHELPLPFLPSFEAILGGEGLTFRTYQGKKILPAKDTQHISSIITIGLLNYLMSFSNMAQFLQ